jgi:hypothetical protein
VKYAWTWLLQAQSLNPFTLGWEANTLTTRPSLPSKIVDYSSSSGTSCFCHCCCVHGVHQSNVYYYTLCQFWYQLLMFVLTLTNVMLQTCCFLWIPRYLYIHSYRAYKLDIIAINSLEWMTSLIVPSYRGEHRTSVQISKYGMPNPKPSITIVNRC